jgi:SAM-dependent methyltransferase
MPEVFECQPVSQQTPFDEISKFISISGKDILEIGGNSSCIAALPFAHAGARSVIVSGLDAIEAEKKSPHEKISIVTADALSLEEKFGSEKFDAVYGVSILEHIPTPKKLFEQVFSILRPGGVAYLQGSPLWSSAFGHHIWLCNWLDGTKKSYHFIPYPGSGAYNPIPDWGHLLYSPEELGDYLLKNDVPHEDLTKITNFIYYNDGLNKETATSIMAAASSSRFVILNAVLNRYIIPDDILKLLRTRFAGRIEDWSVHGIGLVLLKSDGSELPPEA